MLSSVILISIPGALQAQETIQDLDPVIIESDLEQNAGVVEGELDAIADWEEDPNARGTVPKSSSAGTKSNTPLIRTPQTVSVVTSKEMRQRAVQNTSEALRYQAGVASEPYGADPRSDWIRVRGYHAPEYLDGLKFARGVYAWPRVDPYFLERMEILRGPAGSLYGQTPPGGLLNLVSKKPRDEAHGEVRLETGIPARGQVSADIGGPIDENGQFSYRLTGVLREADTQVDYVDDNRAALAGAFSYKPTDSTNLTLLAHIEHDDSKAVQFLPALGTVYSNPNGPIPRNRFTGEPDFDDYTFEQRAIGYLFDHEFDNGLKFSNKLRYSSIDYDLRAVRAFGFLPGSTTTVSRNGVYIDDRTENWNTDTNLSKEIDTGPVRHNLLTGVDYLHQSTDYSLGIGFTTPLDIYNPVYGAPVTDPVFFVADDKSTLKQFGVYVQDQISWNNWEFVVSARNDWYDQSSLNNTTNVRTTTNGNKATWRTGLLYAFENGVSPYASYATSFEPLNGVDVTTGEAYKPTESEQFEVGIKYAPPGFNALFTIAAFNLEQKNTLASNGLVNVQIGKSRVRGLEIEGRIELENGLGLLGAYAYMDSEITSGSAAQIGNRLPFVPEHQATAQVFYKFDGVLDGAFDGLTVLGGVRYYGASFGDQANSVETDAYTLLDAGLEFDFGARNSELEGLSLSISAANLTDETYVSTCNDVNSCYYGAGRTVRGALAFKW
ncbi:MAG: TonB-dependent siderophore receptor [Pseudomonadota bacterium]